MLSMRTRSLARVTLGLLCLSLITPVHGFFEIFSQMKEDIQAIEKSTPGDLRDILEDLEGDTGGGFNDVSAKDWFHQYVTSVARWGIVTGYKDGAGKPTGTFGPGNTVTVAEILKMALKAAQTDETKCKGTPKLAGAEHHWAKQFVVCAEGEKMRILKSSPDLNRAATRAEVLSGIFDAFGDKIPPLFSSFKDTVDHPLESDIAYGAALKIVSGDKDANGKPTGAFRPNDPVKRAEAAKIIYERLRIEVMGERK